MANIGIRGKKISEEEIDLIFSLWNRGYNCEEIVKNKDITISLHLVRKVLGRAFNLFKN